MVQAFLKKWWVESDFKAPNLPLSLRFKGSGCHCNKMRNLQNLTEFLRLIFIFNIFFQSSSSIEWMWIFPNFISCKPHLLRPFRKKIRRNSSLYIGEWSIRVVQIEVAIYVYPICSFDQLFIVIFFCTA